MKIDLGCGPKKREGFLGVDSKPFEGVDIVADLRQRWPWSDGEVDEAFSSHFIEHLTPPERIHFANELFRVLKIGGKATLVAPHWSNFMAYGDLTHQWPPISEFWFNYLNRGWRKENAPHNDTYLCDFDSEWSFTLLQDTQNTQMGKDFPSFAARFCKDAIFEVVATLTKPDRR
jgi:hypothetical protein